MTTAMIDSLMRDASNHFTREVSITLTPFRDFVNYKIAGFSGLADYVEAKTQNCMYTLTASGDDDTVVYRASSLGQLLNTARLLRGESPEMVKWVLDSGDVRVGKVMLAFHVTQKVARVILFFYDNPGILTTEQIIAGCWTGVRSDQLLKQYTYKIRFACGADAIDTLPGYGLKMSPRLHAEIKKILERTNVQG